MRDPSRQIVVTGAGVCCHLGDDLEQIEALLRAGWTLPFIPCPTAVEINSGSVLAGTYRGDLPLDRKLERFMGRAARMAHRAAVAALRQSGLERRDLAVVAGSGTGDVATHLEVEQSCAKPGGARNVAPTVVPRMMSSTVSANLATALGTSGPSFSASAACAGGAWNILLAAELVEQGHVEAAIAGGAEVADRDFIAGFDSMRALNRKDNDRPDRASRPYAADRAGFVFGEGAGIVVLETRAHAEARGAAILGSLRGYGMSSDGSGEMVRPSEEGAVQAMERALRHAGVQAGQIDYVNTHATSTVAGDLCEVRALRRVLGGRHLPYSSTKGYTGHTVSAAGAIEAIFTLAMLRGGWIAPSAHAEPLDPELADYPPVLRPLSRPLELALSNSLGFGGTNVSLVLGR